MATQIQQAKLPGLVAYMPEAARARVETYKLAYDEHRHRVYALAFWMTDNETTAEELMTNTFIRAFATSPNPLGEAVDRALLSELRELMPVGTLSLDCSPATKVEGVRRNTKRVHLERAVVQLPPTERLIFLLHDVESYDHARIARTLGISDLESRQGLHQARLRLREILSTFKD
ncbi:MAG TPA: RNA polymerase sigma factor [Terriglobales bacterium]|nr:RNA polymerase sigma factor [Terriglobales bacterium]